MPATGILCAAFILLFARLTTTPAFAAGKEKTLYNFNGEDGGTPQASVVFDQSGNLYGTTLAGAYKSGTVFQLVPGADGQWTENVLYTFTGGKDGWQPLAGLTLDASGNLYGTTSLGGSGQCGGGCGTVFEVIPGANGQWTEKVLYNFNDSDGNYPRGGVIFDSTGNLYGTTENGGAGAWVAAGLSSS